MSKMSIEEIAEKLHMALGEDLLARVEAGQATAAELNVARQFLKDNGIDSLSFSESPLIKLADVLPFEDKQAMG
jgi:hypothetical protein